MLCRPVMCGTSSRDEGKNMSANCRKELAKLVKRYTNAFDVDVEDIIILELEDDVGIVYSPNLPYWSTGKCP